MARNFDEIVNSQIGTGALSSYFQPRDNGSFSLYTEARLNYLLTQASTEQNQSLSIQDTAQAA